MTPERRYVLTVGVGLAAFAGTLALDQSVALAATVAVVAAAGAHRVASYDGERPIREVARRNLPRYALAVAVAAAAAAVAHHFGGTTTVVTANGVVYGVASVHVASETVRGAGSDRIGLPTAFAYTFPMVVFADRLPWPVFQMVLGYGLLLLGVGVRERGR